MKSLIWPAQILGKDESNEQISENSASTLFLTENLRGLQIQLVLVWLLLLLHLSRDQIPGEKLQQKLNKHYNQTLKNFLNLYIYDGCLRLLDKL